MTPNVIIQILADRAQEHRQIITGSVINNQKTYLRTRQYSAMFKNAGYIVTQDYITERLDMIVRELKPVLDMPENFESVFENIKRQEINHLVNEVKSGNLTPLANGKAIVVEILNNLKVTKE